MLTSLALDILLLIVDHLPTRCLRSLRITCKAFLHVVTPRLFSDACVNIRREHEFLFDLSHPSCTIAPFINTLHVESLFFYNRYSRDDTPASDKDAIRILSQYLAPAVLKLRNLETLRYVPFPRSLDQY
jgi:hypothetical protein